MNPDSPSSGTLSQHLLQLREYRRATWPTLAALTEPQLARTATWNGKTTDVRYLLLRLAESDDERCVDVGAAQFAIGWQPTMAQRILGVAAKTRSALRAALVGVTDEWLDRGPAPGEWTLRQTLAHLYNVEQRYLLQTAYAVERLRSPTPLPIRMPDDRLPPLVAESTVGDSLEEILARLETLRAEVVTRFANLTTDDLAAPTIWTTWEVDARFRLYRFAAHERQHTIQVQKTLRSIGWWPSEAHRILGQAAIARGALESMLIGFPDELAAKEPGEGAPTVLDLVARALAEERTIVEAITAAL